jgi:topoisomerase-4 subunit A
MIELEAGSRIAHMVAGDAATRVLLATKGGMGFVAKLADMSTRQRAGKSFIGLDEGDEPIKPCVLPDDASAVVCMGGKVSKERLLVFPLAEVKQLSAGGKGVILMEIDKGEALLTALAVNAKGIIVQREFRGKQSEEAMSLRSLHQYEGKRARKGRLLDISGKNIVLKLPVTNPTSA